MVRGSRKDRGSGLIDTTCDYDYDDILKAYSALGVTPGRAVYISSDLIRLMRFSQPGKQETMNAHLKAVMELLGPDGTIFVPTASLNLCNTDIPFDPLTTPSLDMGMFSEYVRSKTSAYRSFHPFWSVTGLGPLAREFLSDLSRHAYGYGSVWQKFVERDVLALNVGKHPQFAVPVIHYIETVSGAPYRYTKEFVHPVVRNGAVVREPFYLSVTYRSCDIVRDSNRKIFANFEALGTLRKAPLGRRGFAWSFSHAEFFRITANLMLQDVYCWLEKPPLSRPYQV